MLEGAKPGELSRIPPRRVAGRSAAGLRLVPSDPASTIGRVDVWADESTNVPLRIDVYGVGDTQHPTLTSEMTTFDDERPSKDALQRQFSAGVDYHEGFSFDSVAAANAFAPFLLPMRAIGLERKGAASELGAVGVYGRGPTALLVIPLRDSTAAAPAQAAGQEPERPDGRAERGARGRPPVGAAGGGTSGVPQPAAARRR